MTRRRILVCVATLTLIQTADVAGFAPARRIDLKSRPHARVIKYAFDTASGGDLNDDGARDLLVGECFGESDAGEVHALFGPIPRRRIDLSLSRGTRAGFKIIGGSRGDSACHFSAAGDYNGDGIEDLVVGAPQADNNGRRNSGSAYVIFGSRSPAHVRLRDFDDGNHLGDGVRIDGSGEWHLAGHDVAGIGDVNNDGLSDIAVSAPFASRTYVIFGSTTSTSIDLTTFDLNAQGVNGYVVQTPTPYSNNAYSVGGAGDANGDGFGDLVVGVVDSTQDPGTAFVVFGKPTTEPVDVDGPAFGGYAMEGPDERDMVGYSVASAGDVNGDGLDDVIVGAPAINCCDVGHGYVVFGKATEETIALGDLGPAGIDIVGAISEDRTGYSVAGLGDLNDDGLADVAVGAPYPTPGDDDRRGTVAIVYGRMTGGTVRLRRLARSQGFWVDGVRAGDHFGTSVAGPGDLNDDGVDDLAFSAQRTGKTFIWFRKAP